MARELSEWVDRRVRDNAGQALGIVVDAIADPATRRVEWLAVATGFFGTRVAVVPVRGASLFGDDVVIAHDLHTITSAPRVDIAVGVDPLQQQSLLDHYARPTSAAPADTNERGRLP